MVSDNRELVSSFEELALALRKLQQALNKGSPRYWLLNSVDQSQALQNAIQSTVNIWYQSQGDGRRTDNCYGLIGVKPEIIPLINQVNESKQTFQKTIQSFPAEFGQPSEVLHKRSEQLSASLERTGLARLHLKQCYRQIPVLQQTPLKIGLNWYTSGRSIKKLSIEDAEKKLLKMDYGKPHIQMQLDALARLQAGEYLAQLQEQVPVMRANIIWQENGEKIRKARNCPLPLFFPLPDNAAFPEHNKPPIEAPKTRQRQLRSDVLIEPEVYLPSLRAHRYINKL